MVNVVHHRGRSVSSDDLDDEHTEDHEDGEQTNEINSLIYRNFFGDWYPNNSRDGMTLWKKLLKSVGLMTSSKKKFFSDMARQKLIQFSSKQIKIFTQNFCSNIATSGGFGRVYKRETADGVQVAITLNSSWNEETGLNPGVSMLRAAYTRILIKLFGFFFDTSINSLAYDFMENGSLDGFLSDNNGSIDWEKCYHITVGTAKGLSYLHKYCNQLIIYYDIKPNNNLFDSNFCRRIANSGLVELYDRNINLAPELNLSHETICNYLFGMMFTILVTRNGELYIEKLQLPENAWNKFERGQIEQGSAETNREHAKRILMIALWFVEHIPEDRASSTRTIETLFEGEIDLVSLDKDSEMSRTSRLRNLRIDRETTGTNNHDISNTEIFTPVLERFKF